MRQFLLPRECSDADNLRLEGEDFHYICRVLRCAAGDSFPAVSPAGERFTATIERVEESACRIRLRRSSPGEAEADRPGAAQPELTLVQCIPKGKLFDDIVRQATQAGVSRVVPAMSDRTVPRFESSRDVEKKRARWERVAHEAVQQSGAEGSPTLFPPTGLDALLTDRDSPIAFGDPDTLALFFHETALSEHTLHDYLASRPAKVVLFIGPEGGFSARECEALQESGCRAAYLGPRVLRTETAAIYAIAAVQILILESDSWVK